MLMLANQSPDQSSSLSNWFDTWSCFFNQILQSTWKWAGTTRDFRLQKLFFAIGIFSFLCTSVLRDCGEIGSLSLFLHAFYFVPFCSIWSFSLLKIPSQEPPEKNEWSKSAQEVSQNTIQEDTLWQSVTWITHFLTCVWYISCFWSIYFQLKTPFNKLLMVLVVLELITLFYGIPVDFFASWNRYI